MMSWNDLVQRIRARESAPKKRRLPPRKDLERVFREALRETGDPLAAYDALVRWVGGVALPGAGLEEQITAGHALLHASAFVPEGYYGGESHEQAP